MVMGAGGTSTEANIFLIAKDRASETFERVGKSALGTAIRLGTMSAAFGGLGLAARIITGIVGLAGATVAGVATKAVVDDYLAWKAAVQASQLQVVGLGGSLKGAADMATVLDKELGRLKATSLLQSREAVYQLSLMVDQDLAKSIIKTSDIISDKFGTDLPTTFVALGKAFNEGVFEPISSLTGIKITNLNDLRNVLNNISRESENIHQPNITKLHKELNRFGELVGPLQARLSDLGAAFPLGAMIGFNAVLEFINKNLITLITMLEGAAIGAKFGGWWGAVGGALLGELASIILQERQAQPKLVPPTLAGNVAGLVPGTDWVVVNVTLDGQILERHIINIVTKEVRKVGDIRK